MKNTPSYSEHIDTIIALISFLSMTRNKSKTPTSISNSLSMDSEEVSFVLDNFKSLFRRSERTSPKLGENYYTLHLRYGLRGQTNCNDLKNDIGRDSLPPEHLTALLNFVTQKAENEYEDKREKNRIKYSIFGAWSTTVFTAIIAIVSIFNNASIQKQNINYQKEITQYEVGFIPKQNGYKDFMNSIFKAYKYAYKNDRKELGSSLESIQNSFYVIEPFLDNETRKNIKNELIGYEGFCIEFSKLNHIDEVKLIKLSKSFNTYKEYFSSNLYKSLFKRE